MYQSKKTLLLGIFTIGILFCCIFFKTTSSNAAVISTTVPINVEHFPDSDFRSFIEKKFDIDHDGALSPQEIQKAQITVISDSNVHSLEGLQYLTNTNGLILMNTPNITNIQ